MGITFFFALTKNSGKQPEEIQFVKAKKQVQNNVSGATAGTGDQHEALKTRLRLEVVRTEPLPVIDSLHPDAKDIPGGFEAGTTVRVTIKGKSAYHMVSTTMETTGPTRWAYLRTEHWISDDGYQWRRHRILFEPGFNSETGLWEITGSPFFFFDEKENRWYVYFNYLALCEISPWTTPTLLRRAKAMTPGIEGINGDFEFLGQPMAIGTPSLAEGRSRSTALQAGGGC